ncbi:DUF3999 domain-containing protein [Serratia entomophila]|uniref:DUF3999 domain-containing protein n=1 Tax=Serratia entomophila TaxID=42906 RepID=UPI002179B415|nr:DUF3999 domain-containing protein [Serratia entomophila]CAI1074540.1 Uncharacterised protein [Serratia entomophila]CAI1738835.1 Uncharacterised protein [Serratia entomophila]CAI1759506.1 Uncharacterised protein [Serratia entomophila]CAI1812306.1 Uncharacterised protein [Serratia entomophila]CAI1857089.1 Uncharacterised protein [Serratia entomophila]
MKVKLHSWLLLGAIGLASAGTAGAQSEPTPEKPQDFAYGMPLASESNEPFLRIALPEAVYSESAWPDMRNVRVFNNQGQAVPFALTSDITTQNSNQTYPLRLFPLNGKRVSQQAQEVISLKSAGGLEITLPMNSVEQVGQTYLLEVPQREGHFPRLTQLKLAWERQNENWQTRVSLLYSDDLKQWSPGGEHMPLLDLVSGSDRLLQDTLDLGNDGRYSSPRYLLLVFDDAKTAGKLKILSARGIEASSRTEQQRISLPSSQKAVSASEAEYSWQHPQPLNTISVQPAQDNTVLPLEIDYRSAANGEWHPLAKRVAYSVNGRTAEAIPLNGVLIQSIRLRGINQQWGDRLPQVTAERDRQSLVFNAQGNTPFLLAWGNKAAQPRAIPLDTLIPAALYETASVDALPQAVLQPRVVLGGPERLSAMSAAEGTALWKKGLLWLLLVLGAGALALLALKLWREVQQTTKPQ